MSLKADPRLVAKDITSMTFRYLLIGCAVFLQMRKGSQVKTPLGTLVETDLFEFSMHGHISYLEMYLEILIR